MGCNNLDLFTSIVDVEEPQATVEKTIIEDVKNGAIAFCSHSGGKDSQAMYQAIKKYFPPEQIIIVHAHLGKAEWQGVKEHINSNIDGNELNVVTNPRKGFLQMVIERGMFPSPKYRQCTSDLKQLPIDKFIRAKMKELGATIGYNCIGLRAEESSNRAKRQKLSVNKRLTLKDQNKRKVYDWLPVFEVSTEGVFEMIRKSGQKPFWAYEKNERLSCVFCIMGSVNDLRHGAINNRELYDEYVAVEIVLGHTMFAKKVNGETVSVPLYEKTGIEPDWSKVDKHIEYYTEKRNQVLLEKGAAVIKPMREVHETQLALAV